MTGRSSWLLLVALAAAVLPACGTEAPKPPPIPNDSAPATAALPPRPKQVLLDRLDPCTLGSRELLMRLGVGSEQRRVDVSIAGPKATACAWSNDLGSARNVTLGISVAPDRAARDYLTATGAELSSVAGFGAVDTASSADDAQWECIVVVDAAENQSLLVTVHNDSEDLPGVSHAMLCEKAHVAAEDVMRRLLARTG